MDKTAKHLARIGRLGGLKSKRRLSRQTARAMVAVREARRAFRRFHGECFASTPPDLQVHLDDVRWVAAELIRHGGDSAQAVGRRLADSISLAAAPRVPRDTSRAAEAIRIAAVRRQRPADRLRQALEFSESARALALASLRRRHPERTDRQLVELLLGETLVSGGGSGGR
jgi:hypothetical protein